MFIKETMTIAVVESRIVRGPRIMRKAIASSSLKIKHSNANAATLVVLSHL
jgi:hypothetical protein